MTEWKTRIRCYCSTSGRNEITEWRKKLSVKERAKTDRFLKLMRQSKIWRMPDYRKLTGHDYGELRWDADKKEHRLFGFFDAGTWYALVGCTHKGTVYDPHGAFAVGDRRMKEVKERKVQTEELL